MSASVRASDSTTMSVSSASAAWSASAVRLAAERVDGAGAVQVAGRAEPVAVQLKIGEPVSQTRSDRTGDGQRGELGVPRVRLGSPSGQRHPPRGVDVRLP
jgi:hypothetical protein